MPCYHKGGCGPYEQLSCSECPASHPEYQGALRKGPHPPQQEPPLEYIRKDRVIALIREQFPQESYTVHDPHICTQCNALVFWNSHFQGWYCTKCGNLYRPPKVDHPKVKKLIEAIQAEHNA